MAVSKDTFKTIGGLVVIALIIVGAFLYGDAQHQQQVRQDQNAKRQATQSSTPAANSSVSQAPAKPSVSATPNPIQASAPSSSPAPQAVTQTPQTGPADELIPLAALAFVLVAYRASLPRRAAKRV